MALVALLSLTLTRRQLIKLMIDRSAFEGRTDKGEKIVYLATGKVWERINLGKGETCHNFYAKIRVNRVNSWFHVVLITEDNKVFIGQATLE